MVGLYLGFVQLVRSASVGSEGTKATTATERGVRPAAAPLPAPSEGARLPGPAVVSEDVVRWTRWWNEHLGVPAHYSFHPSTLNGTEGLHGGSRLSTRSGRTRY